MKKIISICAAAIMLLSATISVSATEFSEYGDGNGQNTGEIAVSAYQYSRYMISIPETLDSTDMNDGEVTVSDASLEDGMSIFVTVTNMDEDFLIPVTHKTKDGVSAKVSVGGNYSNYQRRDIIFKFDGADLESNSGTQSAQIHCNLVGQPEAGAYEGTVTYSICCDLPTNVL